MQITILYLNLKLKEKKIALNTSLRKMIYLQIIIFQKGSFQIYSLHYHRRKNGSSTLQKVDCPISNNGLPTSKTNLPHIHRGCQTLAIPEALTTHRRRICKSDKLWSNSGAILPHTPCASSARKGVTSESLPPQIHPDK